MELIEIEAFIAIAESGTFTSAAARLHISQPAISRRIDLLETELETRLFERLRTGARLTDAGEAFLPFAIRVLANLRDASNAVREVTAGERGSLSLAIVGTLANTNLLEQIKVFRNSHPRVRLRLHTANSNDVSRLVLAGDVQLGLRYYDDPSPALATRQIADDPLVVAQAWDSRLVPSAVTAGSDLAGVPWVSFPTGTGSSGEPFARAVDRTLILLGLAGTERITIDSLTAQKRLIEADFGIGLMQSSAITEELRLGTIRVVEGLDIQESAPVYLIRRKGGHVSAAMDGLMEALVTTSP